MNGGRLTQARLVAVEVPRHGGDRADACVDDLPGDPGTGDDEAMMSAARLQLLE
jgi:hypothetical protein